MTVNQHLWARLYVKRWSYQNRTLADFSQQGYRDRHERDGRALKRLLQVSKTLTSERHYGLGRKRDDPMWIQLSDDVKSYDVFRLVARNDDEIKSLYGIIRKITPLVQCVATQLLDAVHYRIVLQNLHDIVTYSHQYSEGQVIEVGALLLAESLWTWKDLFAHNVRERIRLVQKRMNHIALQLQGHLMKKEVLVVWVCLS